MYGIKGQRNKYRQWNWIGNLEQADLGLLFDKEFGPMSICQDDALMMFGAKDCVNCSGLVMDAVGDYKNQTFVVIANNDENESKSESVS